MQLIKLQRRVQGLRPRKRESGTQNPLLVVKRRVARNCWYVGIRGHPALTVRGGKCEVEHSPACPHCRRLNGMVRRGRYGRSDDRACFDCGRYAPADHYLSQRWHPRAQLLVSKIVRSQQATHA